MQVSQWWQACWLVKPSTIILHSCFGSFYIDPILPNDFSSHPIVSTPQSSRHTCHHTECVTHTYLHEQSRTEPIQFDIAPIFSVTTPSNQLLYTCIYWNWSTKLHLQCHNVTSVSTTDSSTGDCHVQVLPSSLTGENIDLFTKASPLTFHCWPSNHWTYCPQTNCTRYVAFDLNRSQWGSTDMLSLSSTVVSFHYISGTPLAVISCLVFLFLTVILCLVFLFLSDLVFGVSVFNSDLVFGVSVPLPQFVKKSRQQKHKETVQRLGIDKKTVIWAYWLFKILDLTSMCCWPPCLLLCSQKYTVFGITNFPLYNSINSSKSMSNSLS